MTQFAETADILRRRRLEFFGNVNVTEIVLRRKVENGEPFDFGDSLPVGHFQREIFIEIPLKNVGLAELIRHDESLNARSIACARPEERVNAISVIVEVDQQKCGRINGVHVTAHLMMIRVELAYELPPIRSILVVLTIDFSGVKRDI